MEKNKKKTCRSSASPHCLVLPYPTQGFTIPMFQFAKRLAVKGLSITLVVPHSFFKNIHKSSTIPFPIHTISDGYDTGGLDEAPNLKAYLTKFQEVGSQTLTQLLLAKTNKKKLTSTVDCIIYSSVLPWALDVAKSFGLVGVAFFNFSCAVDCIYYHVHEGLLNVPLDHSKSRIMVEGLPLLEPLDLPSLISNYAYNKERFDMFVNQFSNYGAADWLFCNTFCELEKKAVDVMMQKLGKFRAIGPHIPSKFLDDRLKHYDKEYGLHTSKPGSHACIKWLKEQPECSVVYISLGSLIWGISEQITELAWGIKATNKSFLWVVEDQSEQAMIPKKFMEETSGKGLVVPWCPQVEALAQRSIGCFVTHCGWNSILEAKSMGVPMVGMPLWSDQITNAKYVKDVWKTGVRTRTAFVTMRETVEHCIREVMEGENAGKMKRNAKRWRESARKAMDDGGSSDRNINEFVDSLKLQS